MTSCDRCVSFAVTVVNSATDHVNDLIARKTPDIVCVSWELQIKSQ